MKKRERERVKKRERDETRRGETLTGKDNCITVSKNANTNRVEVRAEGRTPPSTNDPLRENSVS